LFNSQEPGSEHSLLAAVAFAADRLLAHSDHPPYAQILEALGRAADMSRIALVAAREAPAGTPRMESRQQWTAPGIARLGPATDGWPRYPGRWLDELRAGSVIAGPAAAFPPNERALLEDVGTRSAMLVPVSSRDAWYGHLACHDTTAARSWSPREIEAVRAVAGVISGSIGHRRAVAMVEHRSALLRAIGAGSSLLLEATSWRQALPRVLDGLRTATRARSAWAYGPDPDDPARRLVLLYEVLAPGARTHGGRARVLMLSSEAGSRLQLAGPIHSGMPPEDREPVGAAVAQPGVPSWAVAPMILAPGSGGLVGLDSETARAWSDGELDGLDIVSSALKAAIRRGNQLAPIAIVPSPWGQPAAMGIGGLGGSLGAAGVSQGQATGAATAAGGAGDPTPLPERAVEGVPARPEANGNRD
jgi:GAF domain-containing protein